MRRMVMTPQVERALAAVEKAREARDRAQAALDAAEERLTGKVANALTIGAKWAWLAAPLNQSRPNVQRKYGRLLAVERVVTATVTVREKKP